MGREAGHPHFPFLSSQNPASSAGPGCLLETEAPACSHLLPLPTRLCSGSDSACSDSFLPKHCSPVSTTLLPLQTQASGNLSSCQPRPMLPKPATGQLEVTTGGLATGKQHVARGWSRHCFKHLIHRNAFKAAAGPFLCEGHV